MMDCYQMCDYYDSIHEARDELDVLMDNETQQLQEEEEHLRNEQADMASLEASLKDQPDTAVRGICGCGGGIVKVVCLGESVCLDCAMEMERGLDEQDDKTPLNPEQN